MLAKSLDAPRKTSGFFSLRGAGYDLRMVVLHRAQLTYAAGSASACAAEKQAFAHPLTLQLPLGKMVLVRGPQGSGKRSLLRLIAGLDAPTSGMVRVPPHAKCVFLDETQPLLLADDILHNLCFGLEPALEGKGDAAIWALAAEAGLSPTLLPAPYGSASGAKLRTGRSAGHLPRHDKAVVSVVRALISDPDVILIYHHPLHLPPPPLATLLRKFVDGGGLPGLMGTAGQRPRLVAVAAAESPRGLTASPVFHSAVTLSADGPATFAPLLPPDP